MLRVAIATMALVGMVIVAVAGVEIPGSGRAVAEGAPPEHIHPGSGHPGCSNLIRGNAYAAPQNVETESSSASSVSVTWDNPNRDALDAYVVLYTTSVAGGFISTREWADAPSGEGSHEFTSWVGDVDGGYVTVQFHHHGLLNVPLCTGGVPSDTLSHVEPI